MQFNNEIQVEVDGSSDRLDTQDLNDWLRNY
jgi:hypothetical protein